MVIAHVLIFAISLVVLIESSGFLIEAAARIAKKMGIAEFIIGLTVVSIGTTLPDLTSSIYAAYYGHTDIVVGNVIGSVIINICLILGIGALIARFKTTEATLKREGYILLFVSVIFFIFAGIGILPGYRGTFMISPPEGVALLAVFFIYLLFIFEKRAGEEKRFRFKEFLNYFMGFGYITTIRKNIFKLGRKKRERRAVYMEREALIKDILVILIAFVGVYFGAKYIVIEAVWFAELFNVHESFIALTVVAIGTSMPELSVTISAAKKRLGNIAVGNILGSSITNLLLISGFTSFIKPLTISKPMLYLALPFIIFLIILLLHFLNRGWKLHRAEGIILILLYIAFLAMAYIFRI